MQHCFPNIECRVNARFDSSTFSNVRRHQCILTRARQNGLVANVFKDLSNTCFDMWDNCFAIFLGVWRGDMNHFVDETQKQHTAMIQKTSINLTRLCQTLLRQPLRFEDQGLWIFDDEMLWIFQWRLFLHLKIRWNWGWCFFGVTKNTRTHSVYLENMSYHEMIS